MSGKEVVYVDPSVWLSVLLEDENEQKATDALRKLETSHARIMVSKLVLLEVIRVIRTKVARKEAYSEPVADTRAIVKRKVDAKIRDFMDKITRLVLAGEAEIVDSQRPLEHHMQDTFRLYSPRFGDIRRGWGSMCNYKELGYWDIMHGLNARHNSASGIISCDKHFDDMRAMSDLQSLQVTVIT